MAKTLMGFNDGSKKAFQASQYSNMRGVVDYGNLAQFAPYESGFAFFAVLSMPKFMMLDAPDNRRELTEVFVGMLEKEFISLDGISDMTGEAMELTDNITSMQLLQKTTMDTSVTASMRLTEKSGTPVTKFISTYLRWLHDPKTQAKTYGGMAKRQGDTANPNKLEPGFENEVFNFLYVVTDSSGLNVEKAYLFLNAQPTQAMFSDLFNYEKGDINKKDLNVSFNAFLVDGLIANDIGQNYITTMVNNTEIIQSGTGKINLNSFAMDWSFADKEGDIKKISSLKTVDFPKDVYNNRTAWYGGTPNT